MGDFFQSIRSLPHNFQSSHLNLFQHELNRQFKIPLVRNIKWVWIDGNLNFYLTRSLNFLVHEKQNLRKVDFGFLLKSILLFRFKFIGKRSLCITDNWSQGYFHWMLDCLPRLLLVPDFENQKVILAEQLAANGFVGESLQLLGVNDVMVLKPGRQYFFRKFCLPTEITPTGNYYEPLVNKLRAKCAVLPSTPSRKVYVSRSMTLRRRIENESELIDYLLSMGFEIVHCEKLSFNEQRELFSQTKVLVTNHGAALTNLLFMQEGTKCLELRLAGDALNNCYFSLAAALKIDYYYQLCHSASESTDGHLADISVSIDTLKELFTTYGFVND